MLRPTFSFQYFRRISGNLLLGLLLFATSVAGTTAGGVDAYGPCLAGDQPSTMKCVHYKLQEARRLGGLGNQDCLQPSIALRAEIYFYWVCSE